MSRIRLSAWAKVTRSRTLGLSALGAQLGRCPSGRSTHRWRCTLSVMPAIDQQLNRQVLLQHVRGWPAWVEEMQHAGGQAYAVLTLCRAAEALKTGQQVSKLATANVGRARFPEWSALIE